MEHKTKIITFELNYFPQGWSAVCCEQPSIIVGARERFPDSMDVLSAIHNCLERHGFDVTGSELLEYPGRINGIIKIQLKWSN